MEFVPIFAPNLYSVIYEGDHIDALTTLFEQWTDMEYLEEFFNKHKNDLFNYAGAPPTPEGAAIDTLDWAEELEEKINSLADETDEAKRRKELDYLFFAPSFKRQ